MTSVVQNAIDAMALGSLYALIALGIALIFGIMQLINFAHGELIMIGAYALVLFSDPPLVVQIGGAVVIVVIVALAMERVAFRPVRGASPATLLVTSFALSYMLQNLAILILGAVPRSAQLTPALAETFRVGGISISRLDVLVVAVTIALLVTLAAFLARTPMGIQMRAAAENFDMARLLGVRADRVIATAFAISGLLAAVAGLFLVAQRGSVGAQIGLTPVLFAFIATVVGGMGSLSGAVLGGFLLGTLSVVLQASLPFEIRPYRDAFLFGAVMILLVVRPQGLIVPKTAQKRV
jgi:branched-chain amino acid transport system permease protein